MSLFEPLAGITVLWPRLLWLLALLPVLVFLHSRLAARGNNALAQLPGLRRTAVSPSRSATLRLILPNVLLLLGLLALLAAVSRPQAILILPSAHKDIILALDTSGSMRATDIQPDRLAVAKNAARTLIERKPARTRIGIVTVAGNATIVQSLTDKREDLLQALERVQLQRGSALGSGLYVALATLLPDAGINLEELVHGRPDFRMRWPVPDDAGREKKTHAPGSNRSATIVLLSDGESNFGPDPLEAGKLAAEHGVRVHTVGIGSSEGIVLNAGGWSLRVSLDEEILRRIAEITLGEYYAAGSAQDLRRIHDRLSVRVAASRAKTVEITAFLAAFGALLLAISALCSMLWFDRVA